MKSRKLKTESRNGAMTSLSLQISALDLSALDLANFCFLLSQFLFFRHVISAVHQMPFLG